MQKWEYLRVRFEFEEKKDRWNWHPHAVNGERVSSDDTMDEYLNRLGDQGWELVHRSGPSEDWEYTTTILSAFAKGEKGAEYLRKKYPTWENPPKYAVQSLDRQLDDWGNEGWELVHVQPVKVYDGDYDGMVAEGLTNQYLAVFKRGTHSAFTMHFKRPKP